MPRFERKALVEKFQDMKRRRIPIVGGGAGTGLSAKCEEEGGIDLIVIYNSGRYRMAGRGSLSGILAYGNANEIVMDMAREVLPVTKRTPVLAGVNGTDPFCIFDSFLDQLKAVGFSGIQNFPTVGLIDGIFRANLEETGMSYGLEVDLIKLARARTCSPPLTCSTPARRRRWRRPGRTSSSAIWASPPAAASGRKTALKLGDCPALVDEWAEAALKVNKDAIIIVHGGPVSMPGGRAVHPQQHEELPRLLRRLLHGAAAHRSGAGGADEGLQGDFLRLTRHPGEGRGPALAPRSEAGLRRDDAN